MAIPIVVTERLRCDEISMTYVTSICVVTEYVLMLILNRLETNTCEDGQA